MHLLVLIFSISQKIPRQNPMLYINWNLSIVTDKRLVYAFCVRGIQAIREGFKTSICGAGHCNSASKVNLIIKV